LDWLSHWWSAALEHSSDRFVFKKRSLRSNASRFLSILIGLIWNIQIAFKYRPRHAPLELR
jgi:hypothetical protein